MLKVKAPGPYFPKLRALDLNENNVRSEGLEALFKTQLINLVYLKIEHNNNPQLLNIQLKYPTSIRGLIAISVDVYSLDPKINPNSVQSVTQLLIKTDSFTDEDFEVLGGLNFAVLQRSSLLLKNIYDCSVMKNIVKINKWSHYIAI